MKAKLQEGKPKEWAIVHLHERRLSPDKVAWSIANFKILIYEVKSLEYLTMLSSVPVWQTAPVCHELLQAHKVFLNHTAHIFSMQLCEGFSNESDVIGCVCWFYVVVVGRSHSWHHITASPSQQLPGCWSVSVWFSETDRQNIILQKRVSVCITDKTCMSSIILSEKKLVN